MNFGTKITILYVSFVVFILTLVFLCHGQKVELVSKDYYAQELKFQHRIDAIHNEKVLQNSISHTLDGKTLILNIDSALMSKDLKGTITFFRPSDSSKDVQMKMHFENNSQWIDTRSLMTGIYHMQLSWESKGKMYFKEEVINIH